MHERGTVLSDITLALGVLLFLLIVWSIYLSFFGLVKIHLYVKVP